MCSLYNNSTSYHTLKKMICTLIDSDNHGYDTDVCLHYTLNDMLQITPVYIFPFCSQASYPLKVLRFLWTLLSFLECWNAELYSTGKVWMDFRLSSPGPRTFQGNTQTPCDNSIHNSHILLSVENITLTMLKSVLKSFHCWKCLH